MLYALLVPISAPLAQTTPPAPASADVLVRLSGFAGGDVTVTGYTVLAVDRMHDLTIGVTPATGTARPYRYGGDRLGFSFDAGANQFARWVDANNLAACVHVIFCLIRPMEVGYGLHPADGRASRWLGVWRGTNTTDGFGAGEILQLYVPPTVSKPRLVKFGFAQMQVGRDEPAWLTVGNSAEVTLILQPLAQVTEFRTNKLGQQISLQWEITGRNPAGFQVQSRQVGSASIPFQSVIGDLAGTARELAIELPPPPPGISEIFYEYRLGLYEASSELRWHTDTLQILSHPSSALHGVSAPRPAPQFATSAQGTTMRFAAGMMVDHPLPVANGGTGPWTYRASDLSALGLQVVTSTDPPRIQGTPSTGTAWATLQVTDADGLTDQLALHVIVGTPPTIAPVRLVARGADQQIRLTWQTPSEMIGVTGYRIEQSTNGNASSWRMLVEDTGPIREYLHAGLPASQTVWYRVAAINSAGPGPYSIATHATTAGGRPPEPPNRLTATSGPERVTLTWEPPSDSGGQMVDFYLLQRSMEGPDPPAGTWASLRDEVANKTVAIPPADRMTHVDTGLWPGRAVYYRVGVLSLDRSVEPSFSSPVHATPLPLPPPSPPYGLSVTSGVQELTLRWQAPSESDAAPIEGYRIEQSADGSASSWTVLVAHTRNSATAYTHAGLSWSETVHYRIAAISNGGTSEFAPAAHATTSAPLPPGSPSAIEVYAGTGTITIRWAPPDRENGAEITGYKIQFRTSAGEQFSDLETFNDPTADHFVHTGIPPNATRFYRVAATNVVGTGTWSAVVQATEPSAEPGQAPMVTYRFDDMRICLAGLFVTITVSSIAGDVTEVELQVSETGLPGSWHRAFSQTFDSDLSERSTCFSLTANSRLAGNVDFRAGITAYFRARASNQNGDGPWTEPVELQRPGTAPEPSPPPPPPAPIRAGRPEAFTATLWERHVMLDWSPPSSSGDFPILSYRIEQSADDGSNWTEVPSPAVSVRTRQLITGLSTGQEYQFRIAAITMAGAGPASDVITVTTDPIPTNPGPPDPPRQFMVTPATDQIELSWLPPRITRGATITGYQIEYISDPVANANRWTRVQTSPTTTNYTHRFLGFGTRLYYRVRTRSNAESSIPTTVIPATTVGTAPRAPEQLVGFSGRNSVLLDWIPPTDTGGHPIVGYRIEQRATTNDAWSQLVTHTGSSRNWFLHNGLSANHRAEYRVRAINVTGVGTPSLAVLGSTSTDRPASPRQVTALMLGAAVELRWKAPVAIAGAAHAQPIGYHVDRTQGTTGRWTALSRSLGAEETVYIDTNVEPGDQFIYRVSARGTVGLSRPAGFVPILVSPAWPPPPHPVQVTPDFYRYSISWPVVRSQTGMHVVEYRVEYATAADAASWLTLATVPSDSRPSYVHDGLANAATVYYRVVTVTADGVSRPSPPAGGSNLDVAVALDLDGSGDFTSHDAMILYYAHALPSVLGNGTPVRGYAGLRSALLTPTVTATSTNDSVLQQRVAKALRVARKHGDGTLDLNRDGNVDAADALILYSATAMFNLLDDTQGGADAGKFRCTFLGPLLATGCTDGTVLLNVLRRARTFWGDL